MGEAPGEGWRRPAFQEAGGRRRARQIFLARAAGPGLPGVPEAPTRPFIPCRSVWEESCASACPWQRRARPRWREATLPRGLQRWDRRQSPGVLRAATTSRSLGEDMDGLEHVTLQASTPSHWAFLLLNVSLQGESPASYLHPRPGAGLAFSSSFKLDSQNVFRGVAPHPSTQGGVSNALSELLSPANEGLSPYL